MSGNAGQRARHDVGGKFETIRDEPHRTHPVIVRANAQQGPAKQCAEQGGQPGIHRGQHSEVEQQQHRRPVPPPDGVFEAQQGQGRPRNKYAVGPAAQRGVVVEKEQHLAERQSRHQEEKPAGPQCQGAHDQRCEPGQRRRDRQGHQHGRRRVDKSNQVDGIRANAEEGAMRQADQPRATHQQLQAEGEHRRHQHGRGKLKVIWLGEQRQKRDAQRRGGQGQRPRAPRDDHARANSPVGRHSSTAAMIT